MNKIIIIDYGDALEQLTTLGRRIDQAYPKEEYLELFMYMLNEYFSNGTSGVYREISKIAYDNEYDAVEQVFGEDALALVEMIDAETKRWLPGYGAVSFDLGLVDLRRQVDSRVILEINDHAYTLFSMPHPAAHSRGLRQVRKPQVLQPVRLSPRWRL